MDKLYQIYLSEPIRKTIGVRVLAGSPVFDHESVPSSRYPTKVAESDVVFL